LIAVLPEEIEELKKLVLVKDDIIQAKETYISELEKKTEILNEKIKLLERSRFGRSSEKWTKEDLAQQKLFNEAEIEATEVDEDSKGAEIITVSAHPRSKPNRQKKISDEVPRVIVEHKLSEEERRCPKIDCPHYDECQKLRPVLSKEETEELKFIPAKVEAINHVRYSYGSIKCKYFEDEENIPAVISAPREKRLIPGSMATPSLLSYVAVSKFSDALPFYRQERLFARMGIQISRQTMSNWMIKASGGIESFIGLLGEMILESQLLNMDETTLQVLNEVDKPVSSKSYMWVRVGTSIDRNTGEKRIIILFNYFRDRSKKRAETLTKGYEGVIQTDGYTGYKETGAKKEIWHVGCWAHARRKFYDAYKGSTNGKLAVTGLGYIKKLYAIETRLRKEELTPEEFVLRRKKEAIPVLKNLG